MNDSEEKKIEKVLKAYLDLIEEIKIIRQFLKLETITLEQAQLKLEEANFKFNLSIEKYYGR